MCPDRTRKPCWAWGRGALQEPSPVASSRGPHIYLTEVGHRLPETEGSGQLLMDRAKGQTQAHMDSKRALGMPGFSAA